MVQRKKAPKSKYKERSKARPTSRRSRAALTDRWSPNVWLEWLKDNLGPFRSSGVVTSKALVTKIQFDTKRSLRALFSGQTTFAYCRSRSRPITLTAIDLWVRRMGCVMRRPLLLHLAGLICQPCKAYSFFWMLKVHQGNHYTRSIIEDEATL